MGLAGLPVATCDSRLIFGSVVGVNEEPLSMLDCLVGGPT